MFHILLKMRRFPIGVWYVIVGKCLDTFVSYTLVGLFYLYMVAILKFTEMTSMIVYETTVSLSIVTNFVTAYLADSRIGKYRMLIAGCALQAVAYGVITSSAFCAYISQGRMSYAIALGMVGIIGRALGSGAVLPTLPTLGGDQFDAQHQDLLPSFFLTLYFFDKVGSVLGLVVCPKLRALPCLDRSTCFPLAFANNTAISVLMLAVLLAGRTRITRLQPMENGMVQAMRVVAHGVARVASRTLRRGSSRKVATSPDQRLKADTKHVLGLFLLFTPFPVFWALQQQQNSRWIYQGKRMDGDVLGVHWLVIEPEQMELAGPLMAVLLIPLFDRVIYPLLAKIHLLRTPLPRMAVGMCFAVVSFLVSAQIEWAVSPVDPYYPVPGEAGLRVFNGAPCAAFLSIDDEQFDLRAHAMLQIPSVKVPRKVRTLLAQVNASCATPTHILGIVTLREMQTALFVVTAPKLSLRECRSAAHVKKSPTGNVRVALVVAESPAHERWSKAQLTARKSDEVAELSVANGACASHFVEVRYNDVYTLNFAGTDVKHDLDLRRGGVYLAFVWHFRGDENVALVTVTPGNKVNMLWQLPQIAAIAVAEIFFTVTGNEFAYTQAPPAMRTLVRAAWGATRGVGSLLVIIVLEILTYEAVIKQLYVFAFILSADVLLFLFLAWRFKPRQADPEEESDEDDDETHAMAVADS